MNLASCDKIRIAAVICNNGRLLKNQRSKEISANVDLGNRRVFQNLLRKRPWKSNIINAQIVKDC